MLRRILEAFARPVTTSQRFVPSSAELPELWLDRNSSPQLKVLDSAPTQVLTALCDDYWSSFLNSNDNEHLVRNSQVHRRALEIIASRGTEAVPWARKRLSHDGYDAREESAFLIAQWAESGVLKDHESAVASELVTLAVTPPKDDTKEAQAACAALRALAAIGGPFCMTAIRQVLLSPEWADDDNQWECANILAELTNQPFMEAEDPVAAATAWLNTTSQSNG